MLIDRDDQHIGRSSLEWFLDNRKMEIRRIQRQRKIQCIEPGIGNVVSEPTVSQLVPGIQHRGSKSGLWSVVTHERIVPNPAPPEFFCKPCEMKIVRFECGMKELMEKHSGIIEQRYSLMPCISAFRTDCDTNLDRIVGCLDGKMNDA